MSAASNVSRPSAAASAAVGNVMSPGCAEIALVNGTDGRTSWEFAPAILPLLSVDAAVAEAMRQRQPEANDALPISSAARMRQEHEAAISSAAGASRSAEDRDGFEGEFEDTAAKMHPILRGVLIDDKVYEDATALVALLDCAALTSTRLVVRRPRMISLEGCAALRGAVDNDRDVSRDSVDRMAQHQLNIKVERLIELIGRAETEALWRLADEVLEIQRAEATERADASGQPMTAATAEVTEAADGGFYVDLFIRRYTRDTRPWIAFHHDVSNVTINVALSDDMGHEGGRLHVILDGRHTTIGRTEGEATAHTDDVMHAVSAMRSGVRYSLIMFFYKLRDEEGSIEYQTIPKRELDRTYAGAAPAVAVATSRIAS